MGQSEVYQIIAENPYKLGILDIVNIMGTTPNTISRQVKQLMKYNYIDYILVKREKTKGGHRFIKKYGVV